MVTGGSIAVKDSETFINWLAVFGGDKIILGADAKDGKIAVNGWEEDTELSIIDFIDNFKEKGVTKVISTDISRDGMLSGPAYDLYAEIQEKFPNLEIIASGGISSMDEIFKLAKMKVPGVITGKAIYEGKITLKEIEKYNQVRT